VDGGFGAMRRIITEVEQKRGGASETVDSYFDRIIKYIPADVIAAWVAVNPLLSSVSIAAKWVILAIVAMLTVVWMLRQTQSSWSQSLLGSVSFLVWAFALRSGPFADLGHPEQWGSIALILYTLGIGAFVPKK
jgi:branched-subunit amino acid transport protein